MKRLFGGVLLAMVLEALAGTVWGKEEAKVLPALKFSEPLPVVRTVAEREHIPFEGISEPSARGRLRPGDSVTSLVTLTKKGEDLAQWLVQMTCVELNEKEQKSPPPQERHVYTSAGTDIKFAGQYVAIAIRVLGPYKKTDNRGDSLKETKDMKARVLVNSDNLAIGFDQTSEAVFLLKRAEEKIRQKRKGDYWSAGEQPFPAEQVKEGRVIADQVGLTPERERALLGCIPALLEFWQLASRTPGLQDILKTVVDVPWWAIIMKGGAVDAGMNLDFSKIYSAPINEALGKGREGYGFPIALRINGKPALSCHILATSPRPPLVTCAGILGVAAQSPDGKGPYLMIQIVDARCTEEATKP